MTISEPMKAARDNARVQGRFGEQHHTAADADVVASSEERTGPPYEALDSLGENDRDQVIEGFLTAALWSSTNMETGEPLDEEYGVDDFSAAAMAELLGDLDGFIESQRAALDEVLSPSYGYAQVGHDFWLTRNRHGTGFWDRGLPGDAGQALTDAAQVYGSVDIQVGADRTLVV